MRKNLVVAPALQREIKRPKSVFRPLIDFGDRVDGVHASVNDKPVQDRSYEHLKGGFRQFIGRNGHGSIVHRFATESITPITRAPSQRVPEVPGAFRGSGDGGAL